MQKKLNLSILHYIHFKAKYIVYDSNEIGKEYNNDGVIIFKGKKMEKVKNMIIGVYYYLKVSI